MIQETNVLSGDKYNIDNFPGRGVYINKDELGNVELIFALSNRCIYNVPEECIRMIESIQPTAEPGISESTLLKALAIVTGHIENIEL